MLFHILSMPRSYFKMDTGIENENKDFKISLDVIFSLATISSHATWVVALMQQI